MVNSNMVFLNLFILKSKRRITVVPPSSGLQIFHQQRIISLEHQ
jgi:hypothetical protein